MNFAGLIPLYMTICRRRREEARREIRYPYFSYVPSENKDGYDVYTHHSPKAKFKSGFISSREFHQRKVKE